MTTNVVVIVVDALRADRVGAFGGRQITPRIDELASESAVFLNAFTTSNATDVAVTSLQTGRYPLSHGILHHGFHVTEPEISIVEQITQLPEVLSNAGYRTAKFGRPLGRWHRKGFDKYPTNMESRRAFDDLEENLSFKGRIGAALEQVHPKLREAASNIYQHTQTLPELEETTSHNSEDKDRLTTRFDQFIKGENPFYSFIHLMDTHSPYSADPQVVSSFLENFNYKTDTELHGAESHPELFDKLVEAGEFPEIADKYYLPDGTPTTAITDAHYDASVTQADERVGDIIDILEHNKELEDTVVILLSDHGESLTEHGIYYDHHGLYDVTIHIPLVIKPPNSVNTKIRDFVQITDIAPTIESYTGTKGTDSDGVSLKPSIEEGEEINREHVLAEEAHTQRRRMVRSKKLKLIYSLDGETVCRYCQVQHAPEKELYNLVDDPDELENLADRQIKDVKELQNVGEGITDEFEKKTPGVKEGESVEYEDEDEIHEQLKALGYR